MDNGLFLVEGYKSVFEFTGSRYHIEAIYHTPGFDPNVLNLSRKINLCEISVMEMERISSLKAPQETFALVKIPVDEMIDNSALKSKFSIVLDGIQDPGNLGTIIRTADWFGIQNIVCSTNTADAYNPKTVQASMGSLARINVSYTAIDKFLTNCGLPVFGAVLDGPPVYNTRFGTEGIIVLGSEGNGITQQVKDLITSPLTVPRIGLAESLNVASAAAIICSEIYRT